jgi:PKD repeat protein
MKQKIYIFMAVLAIALSNSFNSNAQCQSGYTLWQDTSLLAPPHTYNGNNTCISAFMAGVDTINYTYTWTWGDGTSSVGAFPTHTYAVTGNYTICLIMQSTNPAGGCNDTTCILQTINKNRAMATVNILNPFSGPTSIQYLTPISNTIYPNPANDKLFIIGGGSSTNLISVFSVDGKLQFKTELANNLPLNISSLSSGMYFIQVQSPNQTRKVYSFSKN